MEFDSNLIFQILSGAAVTGTVVISTIYALKQKNEELKHTHLSEQITKLVNEVDTLKKDTVRVDYLRRIDEDIDGLRTIVQQTREEFVKKIDLRETEDRIIGVLKEMKTWFAEGLDKKVEQTHCAMMHNRNPKQ